MKFKTGETLHELVLSLDNLNNPVIPIFDNIMFVNGLSSSTVSINVMSANISTGTYDFSFSASTYGLHQFQSYNEANSIYYISKTYDVRPDNEVDTNSTVYVGL